MSALADLEASATANTNAWAAKAGLATPGSLVRSRIHPRKQQRLQALFARFLFAIGWPAGGTARRNICRLYENINAPPGNSPPVTVVQAYRTAETRRKYGVPAINRSTGMLPEKKLVRYLGRLLPDLVLAFCVEADPNDNYGMEVTTPKALQQFIDEQFPWLAAQREAQAAPMEAQAAPMEAESSVPPHSAPSSPAVVAPPQAQQKRTRVGEPTAEQVTVNELVAERERLLERQIAIPNRLTWTAADLAERNQISQRLAEVSAQIASLRGEPRPPRRVVILPPEEESGETTEELEEEIDLSSLRRRAPPPRARIPSLQVLRAAAAEDALERRKEASRLRQRIDIKRRTGQPIDADVRRLTATESETRRLVRVIAVMTQRLARQQRAGRPPPQQPAAPLAIAPGVRAQAQAMLTEANRIEADLNLKAMRGASSSSDAANRNRMQALRQQATTMLAGAVLVTATPPVQAPPSPVAVVRAQRLEEEAAGLESELDLAAFRGTSSSSDSPKRSQIVDLRDEADRLRSGETTMEGEPMPPASDIEREIASTQQQINLLDRAIIAKQDERRAIALRLARRPGAGDDELRVQIKRLRLEIRAMRLQSQRLMERMAQLQRALVTTRQAQQPAVVSLFRTIREGAGMVVEADAEMRAAINDIYAASTEGERVDPRIRLRRAKRRRDMLERKLSEMRRAEEARFEANRRLGGRDIGPPIPVGRKTALERQIEEMERREIDRLLAEGGLEEEVIEMGREIPAEDVGAIMAQEEALSERTGGEVEETTEVELRAEKKQARKEREAERRQREAERRQRNAELLAVVRAEEDMMDDFSPSDDDDDDDDFLNFPTFGKSFAGFQRRFQVERALVDAGGIVVVLLTRGKKARYVRVNRPNRVTLGSLLRRAGELRRRGTDEIVRIRTVERTGARSGIEETRGTEWLRENNNSSLEALGWETDRSMQVIFAGDER